MINVDLQKAHKASSYHKKDMESSDQCGCFYCLKRFSPTWVKEWIDGGETALCVFCGIDSVIPSAAGYELSDEFLKAMYDEWFGRLYEYVGGNWKEV